MYVEDFDEVDGRWSNSGNTYQSLPDNKRK